ncbi:hypothetical protein P1P92_01410 [Streptomyces ipomoeae]|nr:hypothetical protein [Streptomyces ipomoeae]MDX2931137.1 hypothetical protein [Streptomyces ipomoeae]
MEVELVEDAFDMVLGGTAGDDETVGDLLVGEPFGDKPGASTSRAARGCGSRGAS